MAISGTTFTSKIIQLQEENVALISEVSRSKQEAKAESAARLDAVKQAQQLQLDLYTARTHVENLSKENEKLSSKVRRLTKRIVRFKREVNKASLTLHKLNPAVTYNKDIEQ